MPIPRQPGPEIATVTQEFFSTLGVEPRLGRNFQLTDQELDGVIVGDALWRSRLHAVPNLAGATIQLHGEPFPVLGVMPPAAAGGFCRLGARTRAFALDVPGWSG